TLPPPPARVQVVAQEYSYTLSRSSVLAGRVIVELVNRGQDAHDLRMRRIGGTRVYLFPAVQPGQHVDRLLWLRAGTYRLWCSIADHRERGMLATLRVVPRPLLAEQWNPFALRWLRWFA